MFKHGGRHTEAKRMDSVYTFDFVGLNRSLIALLLSPSASVYLSC